jgi:carbonic anhydrase
MKRFLIGCLILGLATLPGVAQQTAATAKHESSHHAGAAQPSAQAIWADLMHGNQRFVSGKAKVRDLVMLRDSLAKSQHPKAIVLACSDSRVAPELIFDQNLGDLFVVRSAGNIADAIGVGSIEYAVEHLGSTVLVVLGHTKCGAVTAACSGEKMPTANLQAIVDKIDPAVGKAKGSAKGDELVEAAIKENVHQSAKDVLASSEVLRHFLEEGKLTVFEAEYQLDTGKVIQLQFKGGRQ